MAPNATIRIDIEDDLNNLIKQLDVEFELFTKDKKLIYKFSFLSTLLCLFYW